MFWGHLATLKLFYDVLREIDQKLIDLVARMTLQVGFDKEALYEDLQTHRGVFKRGRVSHVFGLNHHLKVLHDTLLQYLTELIRQLHRLYLERMVYDHIRLALDQDHAVI